MAAVVRTLSDYFWAESFWLPNNHTWNELERKDDGVYYPQFSDMYVPFLIAGVLLGVRKVLERTIFYPIGKWYNLREKPYRPAHHNPNLEQAYHKIGKHPQHKDLQGLSKQTDLSVRQIERWFRYRRLQEKYTPMTRFQETCWRFLFYFCAFYIGLYVLWDKPWLWDTKECWYGHPFQHVPREIYWYYMLELGFYWALLFSLFSDVKRKDFNEMVIHHFVTIGLMVFSWTAFMVRIGTLVLVVHDAVDYIMEIAKIFNYLKYQKVCDALFVVFTIMWFVTRIVIYPFRILNSTLFEGHVIVDMIPAYYVFNILLGILQILHIIWFYMILRMVYLYVVTGKVQKDDRSSSEEEQTDEENYNSYEEKNKQNGAEEKNKQNGATNIKNGPTQNGASVKDSRP